MPEWYEKQMRIIHPSLGRTPDQLARLDPAALAQEVAAQHYNAQHLEYSLIWDGEQKLFLFRTDRARAVPREVLAEYLPRAHEQGIKVFIYMNVHWAHQSFIDDHPRWVQRLADGSALTGLYGGAGTSCCVNSPWRDWILGLIEEMSKGYEIDGIFLDGPCFYAGSCYCESCQREFAQRYGTELTQVADEKSPYWRQFMEFRYDSIARFVADCRTALRRHRPEAPLYMNANGLHSGRLNGRHNRKLIEVQDILGAEGGFIFYERPINVPLWKVCGTAKFLEAQAKGKPTVIFTAAGHKPWEYPLTPPEIQLNIAATFAGGANPWVGCYREDMHDPSLEAVADELKFFQAHEALLSNTQGKGETALMWSHDTADYYRAHLPEIDFMVQRPDALTELDYQASFSGGYEALMRSGTPFIIVDEFGITDEHALGEVRTLLLTDTACMNERTAESIRQFVRDGGTLIATNNTSLFDKSGHQREEFLLSDVFGASYVGPRGLSQWDLLWLSESLRQEYALPREDIPSPAYQVQVRALPGAELLGHYYEPTKSRYSPRPALSDDPAIVRNRYGKGECLYLAGSWAHFYWTHRISECFQILTRAARQQPLASVSAPSSAVEITLRERKDTGEWLVHLLNYTGEMERPMKRIVTAKDVTIRLRSGKTPRRIRALRANKELAWERQGNYLVVTLPALHYHEVIHVAWA